MAKTVDTAKLSEDIKRLVHEHQLRPTVAALLPAVQALGHQVGETAVHKRIAALQAIGEIGKAPDPRLARVYARRGEVQALLEEGLTAKEISDRLGVSYRTIADDVACLRKEQGVVAEDVKERDVESVADEAADAIVRAQRSADRAAVKGREVTILARRASAIERLIEAVKAARWQPPKPLKYGRPPGQKRKPVGRRWYVAVWTDWHAEETVSSKIVGGVNEYNNLICTTRIQSAAEQAMRIVMERQASGYETWGFLNLFNGDMVGGLIHGLDRHASSDIMTAVAHVGALEGAIMHDFATILPPDVQSALVMTGNHARVRHEEAHQNLQAVRESFDWAAGVIANGLVSSLNIPVRLAESLYERFEINNRQYLALHGDLMAAGKGPADRAIKTMKDLSHLWSVKLSGAFYGHYHRPEMLGDRAYGTGSPKGRDGYAHMLGVGDEAPSQALYEIDEYGKVLQHVLYCDRPVQELRYPTHGVPLLNAPETPAAFVLKVGRS